MTHNQASASDIFSRFASVAERGGKGFLLVTFLLMGFSIAGIFRIRIDTDFRTFMPTDSGYIQHTEHMEEVFGDGEQLIVLLQLGEDPRNLRGVTRILDMTAELSELPGITSVQGPVPEKVFLDRRVTAVRDLPAEDLPRLFEFIDSLGDFRSIIREDSSWYGIFRIMPADGVQYRRVVEAVRDVLDEREEEYILSGEPFLESRVFDYILRIILTLPPLAIILMLGVFRWRVGSIRGTALSMLPAVIGAVLTLGIIGWTLRTISIMTALVPIFILVMGSADGLHFMSHVLDGYAGSGDGKTTDDERKRIVIGETLRAVGSPMVMTTLTTMAGFLSFMFIQSSAMRTMGVVTAGGILLAGVATWCVLPAVLFHLPPLTRKRPRQERDRLYRGLSKLRGRRAFALTLCLAAAAVPGITMLRANFNMLTIYRRGTDVRRGIETMNRIVGGSLPVSVTFTSDEDLLAPETAREVLDLQAELRDAGIAERSVSLYSIIARVAGMVLPANSGDAPAYPSSRAMAGMVTAMMTRQNPDLIDTFISDEGPTGRVMFFLEDLENETLSAFEELVQDRGDAVEFEIAGVPFVMKEMNEQIIPQQITSLIAAVLIVLLMVSVSQRSARLGIFTSIPILVTLLVLFGVMGYSGIDLSVITGIMSGLTVGVGIDYAIHFVSLYRYFRRKRVDDPVETALEYVSSPVLANAAGLAIGFTAMLMSPLVIHVYLSVLMWVTMLCSSVLSLTLLPALVRIGSKRTT